jgi:NACHT domain
MRTVAIACGATLLVLGPSLWLLGLDSANKLAGVLGLFVSFLGVLISFLQWKKSQLDTATAPAARAALGKVADDLAEVVRNHWEAEEKIRRLQDPVPLPVRWVHANPLIVDHWANIAGDSGTLLSDLSGQLDDIVDVFKRIPSQRLVVLGEPGAGKTVLSLRFTLDMLARRRPGQPVPVIFSLSSWHPGEEKLTDWMALQLAATYLGGTTSRRVGLARQLVDARQVLPVLDGLDEIAKPLRPQAIQSLNAALGHDDRVLLTCRTDEYTATVEAADVITSAAVVVLQPLRLDDLGNYLPRTARKLICDHQVTTKWNPVLAFLNTYPDRPISQSLTHVLTTPLMTSLARAAYSDTDADPAELLDDNFIDSDVLENHLVDSFISAVFPGHPTGSSARNHDWAANQVQRWLAFLATHLNKVGADGIAWWQLEQIPPRRILGLVSGVLIGIMLGVVVWLLDGLGNGLRYGLLFVLGTVCGASCGPMLGTMLRTRRGVALLIAILTGLGANFLLGPVFGFVFGLGAGLGSAPTTVAPSTINFHLKEGVGPQQQILKTGLAFGLVFGILSVLIIGLLAGFETGLIVGLLVGLVVGLAVGLDIPADVTRVVGPSSVLRADRTSALIRGLIATLIAGLAEGLEAGHSEGFVVGLVAGLIVGALVGLVVVTSSAWARFTIARMWLALRGRLPWRLMPFLAEAHHRGVLRQAGGTYQFRHHRIQLRLIAQLTRPLEEQPKRSIVR